MARPLRIEYLGACYHVTCRGNMRQRVFFSDRHYELFLDKLAEFSGLFRVRIRCYCLMPNHVHLYLCTPDGNLSRFMQSFLTSFCVTINKMRGKSGHIFQGRFKSLLVQDELYRSRLSRYIHLNPVRAVGKEFSVRRKLELLENFRWSSYPFYIGTLEVPDWLDVEPVLSSWGVNAVIRRLRYGKYMREGLRRGIENIWGDVREQYVLGDEAFLEDVRRKLLAVPLKADGYKEQKSLAHLKTGFKFEDVLGAVSRAFRISEADILRRRSKYATCRKLLMYCLCKYCRSSASIAELAGRLSVSRSGLLIARDRLERLLKEDKNLSRQLLCIEGILGEPFS